MAKGLIHVYTGDGKGKTTAAIGISVRAKSRGLRTMFVQFFKENDRGGEIALLHKIGIKTVVFDQVKSPFFNPDIDKESIRQEAIKALSILKEKLGRQDFDLIVLDEFICLISEAVLSEDEAVEFLGNKPSQLELILTGYGATEKIIALADYVTFMKNIKHPYDKKLHARRGIEF
ncbi:MAG: cob(I)yrinic acid a,c-diamide adenosyltransferase [Nitrospiraceae bacterium]|nr:cob(I)yrinic acid a,c-diamide adenosyltransferase [Nitrospiraceae bacterium]